MVAIERLGRLFRPEALKPKELAAVVPVVRAFTVAPISQEKLAKYLELGLSSNSFSFSEVVFLEKSEDSAISAGLLTTPGGWIGPGESVTEAALREIGEETMLLTQSAHYLGTSRPLETVGVPAFTFRIPTYQRSREAHLIVVPVRSSSFSLHVPREGKAGPVDKIKDLVAVSLSEFQELVEKGVVEREGRVLRIVGHLTKASSEIGLGEVERQKRDTALDKIVTHVGVFEGIIREETLKQINRARRLKYKLPARSLADCGHYEIMNGFVAAQMVLGMVDEHQREVSQAEEPPAPADLPNYVQFLSGLDPEAVPEFVLATPTWSSYRALRVFKRALRPTIGEIYRQVGKEFPFAGNGDQRLLNPYQGLREIWPDFLALSLPQRVKALERSDQMFTSELTRVLGVSPGVVKQALEEAHANPQYLTDSLRAIADQFQQGRRMNEVANARLLTLVVMALGFHPNLPMDGADRPEVLRMLRFEAMVTLADFMAAVEAIELKDRADNSLVEGALDTFLRFPPQPDVIELGSGILHPVYHRETQMLFNNRPLHLIVDERLGKDELSIMRKRRQDPKLFDLFSVNLILADDNFPSDTPASAPERFELCLALRQALIAHIARELAPDGWQVGIVEGTLKNKSFDSVAEYLALKDHRERQDFIKKSRKGKRPGSVGDLIVRKKFVLEMRRGKEVRYCEFCLYPYEEVQASQGDLAGSGFWGFREKLEDDAKGNYLALRLIARDSAHPTRPSLYELEFPPFLYEWRIMRLMRSQIHPRKELAVEVEKQLRRWFFWQKWLTWKK